MLSDTLIIATSQLLFFGVGWVYFTSKLLRDFEVGNHRWVQLLFATTFAMSCTLFELVIFEIVDVLSRD